MNKSKVLAVIFISAFFISLICPVALMPFVKNSINENRNISKMPEIRTEEGKLNLDFFDEITTYVSEHFAGRSELIAINNTVKYKVFRTPGDSQVIIGKNGWFYFDQTLQDYVGITMTTEEINQIADNLLQVQNFIESKGKQLVVMIVPNKNSIYDEYMPRGFGNKAMLTNRSILQVELEERGINYLDVTKVLLNGKNYDELYLHKDTHWNNTGARLVLNSLYEQLGIDFSHELDNYIIEKSHESDLSAMLFPTGDNTEEQRIYEQKNPFKYEGRVRSMDDLLITSTNENGVGKSVLVYRDSFGRAMVPYMAECFDKATFNRSTPYDMSYVDSTDCDFVVIEIVERNLKYLGEISIE